MSELSAAFNWSGCCIWLGMGAMCSLLHSLVLKSFQLVSLKLEYGGLVANH